MKDLTIEAKDPKSGQTASVTVKAPETVKEAIDWCGEEALISNAIASWRITLQGNIRNALRKGEDQKAIQERLKDAKMGVSVKGAKIDPVQAYLARFQSATPEEQKKMLAELQKRAAAK